MKKTKSAALIILAAAVTAASMSGCGIIRRFFGTSAPTVEAVQTTAEETTAAEDTTVAETSAAATEAQTTKAVESSSKTETKIFNGAVLIESNTYYDSTLGITFTVPAWNGNVYAKGTYNNGDYSLAFYEASNYEWGAEKGWEGMGMLFTVMTNDTESDGDFIDYPAGSIWLDNGVKYLTYFKPTDVRFNSDDEDMTEAYQSMYGHQRDYFLSGVVDADKYYVSSSNANALNLTSK